MSDATGTPIGPRFEWPYLERRLIAVGSFRLFVGGCGVRRLGVWWPDGLHIWWRNHALHGGWSKPADGSSRFVLVTYDLVDYGHYD